MSGVKTFPFQFLHNSMDCKRKRRALRVMEVVFTFNTSWFKWSTRVKCSMFHSRPHLTSPPAPVCLSHQSALRMCQPHMVPIQPCTKGEYGRHQAPSPQLSPLGLSIVWKRADDQNDQNQMRIFTGALTATLRETSEFNSRKKYYQGQIKSYLMFGNWP